MKKPDNFIFRYGDDLKNFPEDLKPKIQEELRYLWGKFKDVTSEQKQIYKVFEKNERYKVAQRYWEMVLYDFFETQGKCICTPSQGADFLVGDDIYIEAVAPIPNDALKKIYRNIIGDPEFVHGDAFNIKILSTIDAKSEKFLKDIAKGYVEENKISIISVNGSNLGLPLDENAKPDFLGFDTSVFLNNEMKHISGIIYSDKCMYQNAMGNDFPLHFVHNPYAENRLPHNYFSFDHEYLLNEKGDITEI